MLSSLIICKTGGRGVRDCCHAVTLHNGTSPPIFSRPGTTLFFVFSERDLPSGEVFTKGPYVETVTLIATEERRGWRRKDQKEED
jgi:hypothetical protein